jgi:hypothetical protein
MFCPQCKTEYRVGYTECADCHVPLVDRLPGEEAAADPGGKFVKVLETWDITDIAIIKSVLDGEGLQYYIQGEIMKHMRPFDQIATLMVSEEDAEKAASLVKDLNLNYYRLVFNVKP